MRFLTCFILLFAASFLSGCGEKGKILGKKPRAKLSNILAIHAGDAPSVLTLEGTMVEKCPQAGCWFRIDDGTGVIKVDTKGAKFVVTDIPLNRKIKVEGKIGMEGDEQLLHATGLVY